MKKYLILVAAMAALSGCSKPDSVKKDPYDWQAYKSCGATWMYKDGNGSGRYALDGTQGSDSVKVLVSPDADLNTICGTNDSST